MIRTRQSLRYAWRWFATAVSCVSLLPKVDFGAPRMCRPLCKLGFLTTVLVAMAGVAHACAVQPSFLENGSSAIYALQFDAKQDASLEINLAGGTDCYVGVRVDLPTRIALSLQPLGASVASEAWEIRLTRRVFERNDPVVLDERVFAGPATQTFDLISGSYYFALHRAGADKLSVTQQTAQPPAAATHRLVVASRELLPLQSLESLADATRTLHLDRYSGTAVLDFNLSQRVELDLLLDTSQWPADQRASLQIVLTDMQGRGYSKEYASTASSGRRLYHYVLRAQAYRLTLVQEQDHWPRTTLSDAETAAPLTIRVGAIQSREVPVALANLAQWLSDLKIADTFEVVGFYDRAKDAANAPVELRERYDNIFKSVDSVRGKPKSGEPDVWQGETRPLFLVRLRALASREQIRDIERKFAAQGGVSLWDRALRKISLQTNIPSRRIVIDVPVYCSASLVFEVRPGMARRYGSECLMASASASIFNLRADELAASAVGKTANNINLSDAIAKFLPTFLPTPGSSVQFLTKSPEFVDVIVRGLRGHVIKGGSEWEKIQISAVKSGATEVRFIADGMLASGAGNYPPDSQFTKSIEAGNAQDLTLYASTLATAFSDYINKAGQQ